MRLREARRLDVLSLALLAIGLAALEIALKEAPTRGWTSGLVAGLLALSFASSVSFVRRTLGGYGDGRIFLEVADRHPVVDVAVLPIGAYAPRWFMKDQHVNPAETVRIMQDCGARQALGVVNERRLSRYLQEATQRSHPVFIRCVRLISNQQSP
jgi:hypothetical protein